MFSPAGPDDEEPTIELKSGETLYGVVLDLTEGENNNGTWYRLRVKDEERGIVRYFAKDRVKVAAREGAISEGELIYVERAVEEESFDDNGEEVNYLPTFVGFPDGGA